MSISESKISSVQMEIEIDASQADVWMALTENIGQWWPEEFYAGGETGNRTFSLETTPGGRMIEAWDNGGGVLWGTVICANPAVQLQVLGAEFPNWGGPTQLYLTWDLVAAGEKTLLKFSEHAVGKVSESGMREKDKGWQFLWATLKSHIEGGAPPVWSD